MGHKLKFIHCSDIHIGANPLGIEERFYDMGKAFTNVVNKAIEEEVDFVIIGGDFFHKKDINAKTFQQAIDLLEPLKEKEIPVYVTEGNHDMESYVTNYSWLDFLSKKGYIYLLKPCLDDKNKTNIIKKWDEKNKYGTLIEREDCYIVGFGYPGSMAKDYIDELTLKLPENKNKPIITILHTGIDRFVTEGMGGIRESEIEELVNKCDYIALGHIHNNYENKEKKYYNPGSLENIKISERSFDKGFYEAELDLDTREVKTIFYKIPIRDSICKELDVSHLDTIEDVYNYIPEVMFKEVEEMGYDKDKPIMVQIKLMGTLKSGGTIVDIRKLKEQIQSKVNCLYIEILNFLGANKKIPNKINNKINREDIDKEVIKELVSIEGFEENKIKNMVEIIMLMKNYGYKRPIYTNSKEGQEIENAIINMVGDIK